MSAGPTPAPSDAEAIALLTGLVGIPSVSGNETAAAEWLAAWLDAQGFQAEVDAAGSPVGHLGDGPRHIVLLGHIDTVPGEVPVRREGDLLYGRGSVDAKGPLAAFCVAAARVGALPGLRVSVVGAVEEEAASSKGAYHVVNTWPAPDYAVIGEPSGWRRVTLGYKGRLLVHYTLERSMSHTAGEARGACQQAVDYWLGVRAWAEAFNADRTGRFDTLDPSLRHIHSESDGLSERVEMQLGLRLPLGLDLDALEAHLLASRGPAEIALSGREVPFRADKRTPLASAFLAAIRGQGGQPAFVTKTGTSDMNVLGPRWGCPIVAYGPGDSSLDHTPDEHLDLEEYLRAIRVLEDVLRRVGS